MLDRNFRAEAEKRGYIVVAPAAPDGQLFFESGARIFPEFLKVILADYKIQDGKFHIAGPSNGGIAAFHVAAANPQYFLSVTAFPGYMWQPSAGQASGDLEDVRVHVRRRNRRVHVARRDEARGGVPARRRAPSRATPSRRASRTGWRRSPAPTPRGCSTASRRRRKAAASRPLCFSWGYAHGSAKRDETTQGVGASEDARCEREAWRGRQSVRRESRQASRPCRKNQTRPQTGAGALAIRKHRRDESGNPDHGSEAADAAGRREAGEGLELLHNDRLVREERDQGAAIQGRALQEVGSLEG